MRKTIALLLTAAFLLPSAAQARQVGSRAYHRVADRGRIAARPMQRLRIIRFDRGSILAQVGAGRYEIDAPAPGYHYESLAGRPIEVADLNAPLPVTPAGSSASSAAAVQGVTGGVPLTVQGTSSAAAIPIADGGQNICDLASTSCLPAGTLVTLGNCYAVKASPGRIYKLWNNSLTAQPGVITIYDDAGTTCSTTGTSNTSYPLYTASLGIGQAITLDIPTVNGIAYSWTSSIPTKSAPAFLSYQ